MGVMATSAASGTKLIPAGIHADEVNREWRELSRQTGNEAKLSRMGQLCAQRMVLMIEIFELDQTSRRAG